jgi:hypothetical protein
MMRCPQKDDASGQVKDALEVCFGTLFGCHQGILTDQSAETMADKDDGPLRLKL